MTNYTNEIVNFEKFKNIKYEKSILNSQKKFFTIYILINNLNKLDLNVVTSVLNQTFKDFEFLIFIKKSDDLEKILDLENHTFKDYRIKIIEVDNFDFHSLNNFFETEFLVQIDEDSYMDKTLLELAYYNINFSKINDKIIYTNVVDLKENKLYNEVIINKSLKKILIFTNILIFNKTLLYNVLKSDFNNIGFVHFNYYGTFTTNYSCTVISANKGLKNYPQSCLYNYNSEPSNFVLKYNAKKSKNAILCIMPWAKVGGADLFNLNVIKYLKEKAYSIFIIATEVCKYEMRESFEDYADAYYDLTTFLQREYWEDFIKNIILHNDIKLIFQMNSLYFYHLIPWIKYQFPKLPILEYLHAEDFGWRNGGYPKDSTAVSQFIDKTFTCNEHLKTIMHDKMNRVNDISVKTLYIGVDTEKFNPDIVKITDKTTEEFCKGKKVILFPSRFSYEKRPIFLLNLMKKIKEERNDIVCIMVGDGDAKGDIIKFINKYSLEDVIKLIPMQSDIRQYYKLADITIICSLSEGITLTTYESLSMNKPVVTADVGGQREIVKNGSGMVIKTYQDIKKDLYNFNYSEEELISYKNAIYKLLNNHYPKNKLRNKVISNYSQQRMLDTIETNINALIVNKSKIKQDLIVDENFAIRFLVLFNETSKVFFNNSFEFDNYKQYMKNKLWKKWWWRGFVKCVKLMHLDKIIKKIYFRGK